MASTSGREEYLSSPIFDGSNYFAYKEEMESFLQAKDYYLWFSVERGPTIPMINGIAKSKLDWNKNDVRQATIDQRAFHTLKKSIDASQLSVIHACKSAKDIWETLASTFEGNDQVKSSKRAILIREYELFEMHPNERIHDMRNRLVSITNKLQNLGKVTSNEEIVRKILYCLTPEWDTIKTAIIQAKDITKLSIGDLIAALEAHEAEHQGKKAIASTKKDLAFKTTSSLRVERSRASSDDDESSDDDFDLEEMEALMKKFMKFMKSTKKSKSNEDKKEVPRCFECDKLGHMRKDCFIYKKKKNEKMKALMGDDSLSSEDKEQEEETKEKEAHYEDPYLCFMTNGDDDEVVSLSYDELLDKYSELYHDSLKIKKNECKLKAKLETVENENLALKDEVACLKVKLDEHANLKQDLSHMQGENDTLVEQLDNLEKLHEKAQKEVEVLTREMSMKSESKHDDSLVKEVNELKAKNLNLQKSFSTFMLGHKKLDEMLETQRPYLDKTGLGYNPPRKQKKFYKKKKSIVCFCCHKEGHGVKECPQKKSIPKRTNTTPRVRRVWVPKASNDVPKVDHQEPKKKWVPKPLFDAYEIEKVFLDNLV